MENEQPKNEASIHSIDKNNMKEPKRILTDQERAFVELMSDLIIYVTNNDDNELNKINDQEAN